MGGPDPHRAPVTLVIAALTLGGAERSAVLTARGLVANGYAVAIVTLAAPDASPAYTIPANVTLTQLGLLRDSASPLDALCRNLRRLVRLGSVLRAAPGTVISFVHRTNILTLFALAGSGKRVIVCEESEPSISTGSRIWDFLRPLAYRLASGIVVHTRAAVLALPRSLQARAVVIPNIVELADTGSLYPTISPPACTVLAVGRLEYEKGFDILIEAFAQVANQIGQWSLTIIGEGSQRRALQAQIDNLGMATRIQLAGALPTSLAAYRQASIFASASRHEAFGLAIGEAMLAGLAVIATACPNGPAELIEHEGNGLLVTSEDPAALAAGLARLMGDATLRADLGMSARRIGQKFSASVVDAQWLALIASDRARH